MPAQHVMSDSRDCLVFIDAAPRSGSLNMAIDEALLDQAVTAGLCAARVYEWSEPTVSLGYFQDVPEKNEPTLANIACVRRLSGGGAILHHHELTYSCFAPPGHPLAVEPHRLYDLVHESIVKLLSTWGIPSRQRAVAEPEKNALYLCFGRGDPHDIVVDGFKIVGSAQRRRKGAVLQHGAVLLKQSPHAPEYLGALDLLPECSIPTTSNRDLGLAVAESLGRPVFSEWPCESVMQRALELERLKYTSTVWRKES